NNALMRNTPKSESLLRAQADRAEREEADNAREHRADGAPDPDESSEVSESGSRSRSAALRSARADLSAHARGVESMNEALHPRGD
ncbi:hypothetical protein, partial [Rhodococcus sp. IEGM 1379]|uniref:hypothetical protein n=1 Tax=Rhodococcus sp. IEGM 1379 TaxID=3047086 RepID=UPI0024B71A0E